MTSLRIVVAILMSGLLTSTVSVFPQGQQVLGIHSPVSGQAAYLSDEHGQPQAHYSANGVEVEVVDHPSFSEHKLRIVEPNLCDTSVKQRSGYLDISDSRHLFFWFFEARNSPADAPLMLWLNGGPGASTIGSGLLFENGPCSLSPDNTTVRNDYSWNEKINIIYLDEPVGTGYSYATDGSKVTTLTNLAVDVYAFLQVFMHRFPQYVSMPFHLAAESWGGHFGPNIAHYIFERNQELVYAPRTGMLKINLASVILANGLTEPASQFESIFPYICGAAPYHPLDPDGAVCKTLKVNTQACLPLIHSCYRFPSNATCLPATGYCWSSVLGLPLSAQNKNPYDLRVDCADPDGLCYADFPRIEAWLNRTDIKIALGVDPSYNYVMVNSEVNQAFYLEGQAMLNSAALLPALVNHGIRLMAYAGNTDGMCNYMGVELWMSRLEHRFHDEFTRTPSLRWATKRAGTYVGEVRSAGPGAGNVTFVQVYDAGHMAPYDQPEATLDMIIRWVDNDSFA